MSRRELIEAAKDYKYLLNRGYPQKHSLDLVASRWRLSHQDKMILYRCIHPSSIVEAVRSSMVSTDSLVGAEVVVDTYNVLLTVYAADACEEVYMCDDGFVRDALSVKKPIIKSPELASKAMKIVTYLSQLGVSSVKFVMERQVSMSGKLAETINTMFSSQSKPKVEAYTVNRADKEVIIKGLKGSIVCSSDIVVLTNAKRVFDIAGYIIMKEWYPRKPNQIFEYVSERSL